MIKYGLFLACLLVTFESLAVEIDMSDLDREVRSSASRSIMFRKGAAEEEAYQRQMEEEQRREAERQSKLKQEQKIFRPYNLFGKGLRVVATINGEMISNKDLQERANLLSLTTGINISEKNKKMVSEKVLQNTVDEKIKLQEALKQGVAVSDKELQEAYRNFEKSNGVPAGKFADVLKEYHISRDVFMSQLKANLLWGKLVGRRQNQNIAVSERELEAEFERIKKDMSTPKYMVSEIVIKKKDAEHIDELVEILRNDPRFELYAAQFSQSASAPSGGKLGWVSAGQLAEPLDKAIRRLKEGQVSNAVVYRADYYIFKLDKLYDPKKSEQQVPDDEEVRKFIQNRKTDEAANKYIRDLRNRAVVEKKF